MIKDINPKCEIPVSSSSSTADEGDAGISHFVAYHHGDILLIQSRPTVQFCRERINPWHLLDVGEQIQKWNICERTFDKILHQ